MYRRLALVLLFVASGCGPAGPDFRGSGPQDGDVEDGAPYDPGDPGGDRAPSDPGGLDPEPADPDPGDIIPSDPDPADPGPGDVTPADPDPGDALPPGDLDPGDPLPGDSDVGDPVPSDPDPGDLVPGDPAPGDSEPSPPRLVWYQLDPWSAPSLVATSDTLCARSTCQFLLEGPALDPWRVTGSDATGNQLEPYPLDAPGDLVPEYLGGGVYSETGYAVVSGAELQSQGAVLTITIGTEDWSIANTCPAALLAAAVFPDGLSGPATPVSTGDTVCVAPAPWTLAVQCPPASLYSVAVFDYDLSTVTELDETQLPQDAMGRVSMPALPASGHLDFKLLDANGLEVERVVVYLACP